MKCFLKSIFSVVFVLALRWSDVESVKQLGRSNEIEKGETELAMGQQ